MILMVVPGILIGCYALLSIAPRMAGRGGLDRGLRGRISLALLFLIAGVGHFVWTNSMVQMMPDGLPLRATAVIVTGVLEVAGAVGLLIPRVSRLAGICLMVLLVAVFPANVHAAMNRIPIGGHEGGPAYLMIRALVQALLLGWAWWFAVRPPVRRV